VYKKVLNGIVDLEDVAIILDKNKQDYEDTLRLELPNINVKIDNINKIKHLLLYDENDLSIIDYILNKL
jgi:hypothetical protein